MKTSLITIVTASLGRLVRRGVARRRSRLCNVAILVTLAAIFADAQERLPRFETAECAIERGDWARGTIVECGRLLVRETRNEPKSRTLILAVLIVRARETKKFPPLVMLHGGPGESGIRTFTPSVATGPLSRFRDVIIYDQRASGFSSPKLCPEYREVQRAAQRLKTQKEREKVWDAGQRSCIASLNKLGVNRSSYSTAASALDLVDLRKVLEIKTWDVYGGSYGARLAQEAMRKDPEGIRTVVLQSPVTRDPTTQSETGMSAQRGLERIFADCRAQEACRTAFPSLERDFYEVYDALSKEPILVRSDQNKGDPGVYLDHRRFLGRIRNTFLGRAGRLARVPLLINELRRGDKMRAAAILAGAANQGEEALSDQVLVQLINCYDIYGRQFLRERKQVNARVWAPFKLAQYAGCEQWHERFSDPSEQKAVSSSIPTLILGGRYDDRTPMEHARRIASTLKTAYVFEFADMVHGGRPGECPHEIMLRFWENPMKEPDASCIASIKPIQFLTSWN